MDDFFLKVWGIYWLVRLNFLRSPFLSLRNVKYNMNLINKTVKNRQCVTFQAIQNTMLQREMKYVQICPSTLAVVGSNFLFLFVTGVLTEMVLPLLVFSSLCSLVTVNCFLKN